MDGYAVRSADLVETGDDSALVRVVVRGEVAAGDPAALSVRPGEAVRIMTGAPVPEGADCIVMVEATGIEGDRVVIDRRKAGSMRPGTFIRRRGEDVRAGDTVIPAGSVLGPRRIGLAAALGHAVVPAYRAPRVVIVSTGAELVEPGIPLRAGQIYDANSYLLEAAVREMGVPVARAAVVGDSDAEFLAALDTAVDGADLVVTTGGVSMGDYDVVKSALRDRGVEFVQVAMQPGKPQGFGRYGSGGTPILTLPGNPVSAFVSFEVFVRPAIRQLLGMPLTTPLQSGRMSAAMRSPRGRRQFARVIASPSESGWRLAPLEGQGSHFVADLARANALAVVSEEVVEVSVGDVVDFWLLAASDAEVPS